MKEYKIEDDEIYDRMNPTYYELMSRLEEYSKVTYGKEAYQLSTTEALLILRALEWEY